jgi:hypothetical protein
VTSPDRDFKAFLADMDSSRWPVFEDESARQWIELGGGVLTYWIYYKTSELVPAGTQDQIWSVKLSRRIPGAHLLQREVTGTLRT